MIGWILAGLLLGTAIVITVNYLNDSVAKQKAKENVSNAVSMTVKDIVKSGSVKKVKMDVLNSYGSKTEIEFEAEDVSSDIRVGRKICI